MKTPGLKDFETLVDKWIQLPTASNRELELKMSLLERRIEQWRIERDLMENSVPFQQARCYQWFADGATLHAKPDPGKYAHDSTGTPALRLQCPLLVYLLQYPSVPRSSDPPILHAIKAFTRKLHQQGDLSPEDFVKTKTGVIRCYTNTRFAANKLRDYGLLKFTQKEAFKVWTLSLPGVLVAALTLQANGGRVDMRPAVPFSGLHPQILKAVKQVNEFSSLVDYLKCLCEPNTDIFDRLEPILKNADKLLVEYWRVLQNGQMATKQRSQASLDYTRRLEQIPDYSTFMQQLSDAIQIDLLLQKATQRALEFPENPNGDLFS